jgi:hypothetical protein
VVQDLTYNDIRQYVKGHFESQPAFNELQSVQPAEAAALLSGVVSRAEGVFLWVAVVVRILTGRLTEGDRLEDLHATLTELPQEIEHLFDAIRRRINTKHIASASRYFLLLLAITVPVFGSNNFQLSAVTLLLADEDEESVYHRDFPQMCKTGRSQMIAVMRRRVYSRTMGLLSVSPSGIVECLHRTVFEWITRGNILASITRDAPAGFDPNLELLKATATELTGIELGTDVLPQTPADHSATKPGERKLGKSDFWRLFSLCLQYAANVNHEAADNAKLVRILDKLSIHTSQVGAKHSDMTASFQLLGGAVFKNPKSSSWVDLSKVHSSINRDITFVQLAAKFSIFPFVAVKADTAALRNQELLFYLLFPQATLGHNVEFGQNSTGPELVCRKRLQLVSHLLHAVPRTWVNWTAIKHVKDEAEWWLGQHGGRPQTATKEERDFFHTIVHLLRKELRHPAFVWRSCLETVAGRFNMASFAEKAVGDRLKLASSERGGGEKEVGKVRSI